MEVQTVTGLVKKAAREFPSRRAITVPGGLELSHERLDELVESAAAGLVSDGVRPGAVVALVFPNTVEFVVTFLAVVRARGAAAPLNGAYTAEEFEFYLSDSGSTRVLTGPEGSPAAQEAASRLGLPHAAVSLPGPSRAGGGAANEPSDVALVLYTSGTTSRPKGVPLSQRNLAASVANIRAAYRLTEADATVDTLPLFHVHGLVGVLLSSLGSGGAVGLQRGGRFSASAFWADMRAVGATWFTAVPTVHQILLSRHASRPEPGYPRLRFVRSCSAALAPAVLGRLEAAFGAAVVESYAMTEAAHMMATNPLAGDGERKVGSVGRVVVGMEMKVLGEDGVEREVGREGEVCVRGANVTSGYLGNPEANREAFRFGWFHTGDLGFVDSDGYLFLVGRIKELINRGGEKISPVEVDAVLLAVPGVTQAVAFGVPDDKYGEEVNCAVVPEQGVKLEESDVVAYCKKNLAMFKVPKKVFVTDSLPRTATGKIQRRVVAEHFLSKISAAQVSKVEA
ncbi:AMP-dependent synthetase and ligase family protein [Wolffia australiana]